MMLIRSGLKDWSGSWVQWFRSVLRSSCTYCIHKTSLSFMFKSTPPSFPPLPHDNKAANRAVWSDNSHLGQQQQQQQRPSLPPLSLFIKRESTGLKGCSFSQKPCCLQYMCELNMYRVCFQRCPMRGCWVFRIKKMWRSHSGLPLSGSISGLKRCDQAGGKNQNSHNLTLLHKILTKSCLLCTVVPN